MLKNHLSTIQQAITERIVLNLKYRSGANVLSERNIEPMALFFTQDQWVLVAYCKLRLSYREFRLDRVAALEKTVDTFPPNQFSLGDYYKNEN